MKVHFLRCCLIALVFYLIFLSLLINGRRQNLYDTSALRLSPPMLYGKQAISLDNTKGDFKENILDHAYFRLRDPKNKQIFILGSSFANLMPPLKFSFRGETYEVYSFAYGGNSIQIPMKLFALLAHFKPDFVIFGMTPLFLMEPFSLYNVEFMQKNCNAPLRQFEVLKDEFAKEPECHFYKFEKSPRAWLSGIRYVLSSLPSYSLGRTIRWDIRIAIEDIQTELGFIKKDLDNSIQALVRGNAKNARFVDMGELNLSKVQASLVQIHNDVEETRKNPEDAKQTQRMNLKNGRNESFHWEKDHPTASLREGGAIDRTLKSIFNFSSERKVPLVFYNTPTAYDQKWIYPGNYYLRYEKGLRDFSKRTAAPLVDMGRLFPFQYKWMGDFIHTQDRELVGRYLIYKIIEGGYL